MGDLLSVTGGRFLRLGWIQWNPRTLEEVTRPSTIRSCFHRRLAEPVCQDQFEPVAHETVLPCAIESIDIYEDTIAVAGGSQLRILRMHPTSQPGADHSLSHLILHV